MIIVLKNADFSASNIGTLSTWRITRSLGAGTVYEGPTSVDKEGTLTATVTIAEGYELGVAGVTITMGGEVVSDAANVQGNIIYISIPVVSGNVVIKVPTVNINTGEEEEPDVPEVVMTSLSVGYTQGNTTIFESQELDDLRRYLTVQASYSDGTEAVVDDYVLSGDLQVGISTITASYGGKSTTFNVETTEFVLPEGYTKYGYIQAKSNVKGSTQDQANFIWLPALENINTLSFEGIMGQKSGITNGNAGVWGARPSEGLGYSFYWAGTDADPAYIYARGAIAKLPSLKDVEGKIKLVIDNPETSPFTVTINNETTVTASWDSTTDAALTREIVLFNNIPEGSSSKMYINHTARIGDMLFRNAQGECVAYFTPCTSSDNKIGMYDQISKTFYTASNAASVTVGNSSALYQVGNW